MGQELHFNMKLIVGLGNYPKEYALTRHNIGFIVVDYLHDVGNFEQWSENKKLLCNISKGSLCEKDCILIKPNTYMNLSGDSVVKVMHFFKIIAKDLVVIHDEIDFNFGIVKTSQSRNSAGHNGIKSINSVVNDTYNRVRVGVGRPENKDFDISDYVLSKFNDTEIKSLDKICKDVFEFTKTIIEAN